MQQVEVIFHFDPTTHFSSVHPAIERERYPQSQQPLSLREREIIRESFESNLTCGERTIGLSGQIEITAAARAVSQSALRRRRKEDARPFSSPPLSNSSLVEKLAEWERQIPVQLNIRGLFLTALYMGLIANVKRDKMSSAAEIQP